MRILIDARPLVDPRAGGVTKVAAGLLPALVEAMPDAQFVFVTSGIKSPSVILAKAGIQSVNRWIPASAGMTNKIDWHHVSMPNKLWSLGCALNFFSLDRWFKRQNFDLILLPNIGWVGSIKRPYALIVHDLSFLIEPRWFTWKTSLWHKLVRAENLIKQASHLFAVSERTKQDLMRLLNIPAERITVIPVGRSWKQEEGMRNNDESVADLPPQLIGKRYMLALGANDPRKNIGCAIAAVKAIRQNAKFKDVELVLVGSKSVSCKLTPVSCLGHPSDRALATLMKHASAFLYPSWYEGFGLPLHEAARFGTPCIASTAGALPETAPQNTLFAPPSKPHLWSAAIEMILNDPTTHQTSTDLKNWSADKISRELRAMG
ncbi:MAG: glycosyltransferase family 1 protein [Candidatus Uhrbacteria bacterium]|nr:glycosyltransferase family 1 protein [Candidatus Uhrbacteria bacterium]